MRVLGRNSAIDELIPARLRGKVDLIVNGSYWLGAAAGAASTLIILNPRILPLQIGWRVGFGAGAIIGIVILYLRKFIPESPRWLMTHGQLDAAEKTVRHVEQTVAQESQQRLDEPPQDSTIRIHERHRFGLIAILTPIVTTMRSRAEHAADLLPELRSALAERTALEWEELFGERVPCAAIRPIEDLFDHPQVLAEEMVTTLDHPVAGRYRTMTKPIKFANMPGGVSRASPTLGQHSDEVLSGYGFERDEITELRNRGVVR